MSKWSNPCLIISSPEPSMQACELIEALISSAQSYIFAISFPNKLLMIQVNTITTRCLQLRVHIMDPLLQANQADLPVQPSCSPFPAITPS